MPCPVGYFGGSQTITNYDECQTCQSDCQNCTTYDYCVTCNTGLIQFNGLCLSACPIFYYPDGSATCQQCSQYCTNCTNSSHCLSCIGSYLHNHVCISTCPAQTYAFESSSCQSCISPCFNCTGNFTCSSCVSGYIYFHSYCVLKCPSDVWYYPSNNTCNADCPYNKYTATMTCYIGACGSKMVSLNGYCLTACAQGYYVNTNQ